MTLNLKLDLKKENLIKNKVLLIAIGMGLFFLWFAYNKIYKTTVNSVRAIDAGISRENTNVDILKRLNTLQHTLDGYRGYFAKETDASWLMDKVSKAASGSGLNIISMSPQPLANRKSFVCGSVNLTTGGTYHQLGDFVARMENSKEFIKVEKLSFKKSDEILNADMVISAYFWKQITGKNESGRVVKGKEIARQEIIYAGRQGRDPLDNSVVVVKAEKKEITPPGQEEPPPFPVEKFSVSAVIWGTNMPQAIINDKIVGMGEQLEGGKIVGIDKGGIHIDYGGKEVLLQINENKI